MKTDRLLSQNPNLEFQKEHLRPDLSGNYNQSKGLQEIQPTERLDTIKYS